MPAKTAMWFYIIILALMVFGLWCFFFTKELARLQPDQSEAQSLGEILLEFKDSVTNGSRVLEGLNREVEAEQATTALTEEQKQALSEKVKARLEQ